MPNTVQLQVNEYTPGRRQAAHDHDEVNVSIVLRGTVMETVGGVTEHAGALSVVVKDRGVRHTNQFGSRGATLARLAFRDRGVSDLLDDSRRVVEWKWSHHLVAVAPFLRLVARYGRGEGGIDANDPDVVDLLVVLSARRDTQRANTPPAWLVDALTWLRSQWHPALGVSDVAEYANVHPVYLARCVRRWYGHSVGDELRRLRLGSAAQGVAFRAGDLSQVAFDNGYADQAHLCREFRRATGVTPGTYRATVRELTALTRAG